MELKRLLPDHSLQQFLRRLKVVPCPVEWLLTFGLHLLVVQALEIRMFQALFHRVALLRIEYQHFAQEIQRDRVGLRIQAGPALLVALGQLPNVLACQIVADECHVLVGRRAEHGNGSLDLVQVVIAREQGRATQQLRKDAANGPHVESVRVVRRVQDDLRGTIPARHNILGERRGRLLVATGKTKITNLQVAILVEK